MVSRAARALRSPARAVSRSHDEQRSGGAARTGGGGLRSTAAGVACRLTVGGALARRVAAAGQTGALEEVAPGAGRADRPARNRRSRPTARSYLGAELPLTTRCDELLIRRWNPTADLEVEVWRLLACAPGKLSRRTGRGEGWDRVAHPAVQATHDMCRARLGFPVSRPAKTPLKLFGRMFDAASSGGGSTLCPVCGERIGRLRADDRHRAVRRPTYLAQSSRCPDRREAAAACRDPLARGWRGDRGLTASRPRQATERSPTARLERDAWTTSQ